jgi:Domain of unknown function (DUF4382)
MTDAPACGFDKVNVTVSKLRIHQSDSADVNSSGWTDITLTPPQKINLLDLNDPTQPNFALATLGEAPLPAGHYTQLRLVLMPNSNNPNSSLANSVVLSGQNTETPLATPSGTQSGIKLIHEFLVKPGERVDLLLDFDACKSIVARNNGTYALKPVIRVIPYVVNGIEGYVDPLLFQNQSNVNDVVVSAQVKGNIVRSVVPNPTTGKFFLAYLPAPANYDVVVTADNHATAVISGVSVPNGAGTTTISTSGAPIGLNASVTHHVGGTITLNPADDDGSVLVAAKQSLVGGPIVTIRGRAATVLVTTAQAGDYQYDLTLPAAAPALGQFSASLPINITSAGQLVGVYEISATGQTTSVLYATQVPSPSTANISSGDALSQDLTLTP